MCHLWILYSNLRHNLREKSVGTRETMTNEGITADTYKNFCVYDVYKKTSSDYISKIIKNTVVSQQRGSIFLIVTNS